MLINDCDLPLPTFRAMQKKTYVKLGDLSPSSIKMGIRQLLGNKRFKGGDQLASRQWRMYTGTLVHIGQQILLQDDPEFKCEIPMSVKFNDVSKFFKLPEDLTIGGTCDLLHIANNIYTVWDYKTLATVQMIDDEKIEGWTEQINIYRWLLIVTGTVPKVDHLYVDAFYIDWSPTKAIRSRDVNDIPCPTLTIPMWDRKKCEEVIYNKAMEYLKYKDSPWDEIPYCDDKARWYKPPKWSVCKVQPNGELGSQLKFCGFDNEEDANQKLMERIAKAKKDENFGIKKSGGESTMCKDWCDLARNGHCDFLSRNSE